ncbi:hypothetical protein ARMGADRAFT_1081005 [Armillaria gallica]|uniref:Uncharacterized protein n=1 Tax=Armillaria gallica TaxID=47427 RepID=A0A2H3DXP6_ARMGA|nr:hypothetical protein ARMGADRAFT_1081005 [Armillaria gallica]
MSHIAEDSSPSVTSSYGLYPIVAPIPSSIWDVPQAKDLSVSSQNHSMDNWSSGDYWYEPGISVFESEADITFPEVTISAFNETGQGESSIKVPLQRSFTGTKPVIPSSLADTPCTALGIPRLLDLFNTTLRTSYTLDTPSLFSVLEECIKNNYDFGTAYGRLRAVWGANRYGTIQNELHRCEANDWKMRQQVLQGNQIVNSNLHPRRVWDLYANRVVPWWSSVTFHPSLSRSSSFETGSPTRESGPPISHAWMDAKDRINIQTPINGHEWPVPIPKDADLNLIRIEMLNLGVEYTWLDVLCLRQKGGMREELRKEEWKLDVPTIGSVYKENKVVIYLSGLGRPLTLKEGDLESDQCWFRRAWTVQEVGKKRIIAGDMPDGPLHAELIDDDDTGILIKFHQHLQAIGTIHPLSQRFTLSPGMFEVLSEMQKRVSTNPVDKVAGLAIPLMSTRIPVYNENLSLEDAWTALLNAMHPGNRGELLFWYPEPGDAGKKWRPSWEQVMKKPLPVNAISYMDVQQDGMTGDDCYEGPCVDKGFVQGLAVGGMEKVARHGELIVKHADGIEHTFNIIAHHGYSIPEDTYTLLGTFTMNLIKFLPCHNIQPKVQTQYWVIGRRLSGGKFEKVSVLEMDNEEVKRLHTLRIVEICCRNILI